MPRGALSFREADVERLLRVLRRQGVEPHRVRYRVERTCITLIPDDPNVAPATIPTTNEDEHEWDGLEP